MTTERRQAQDLLFQTIKQSEVVCECDSLTVAGARSKTLLIFHTYGLFLAVQMRTT